MLNSWLGPRKTEEEHRVEAVVWHNPPGVAKRLGDMTAEELRAELAQIHEHFRKGGVVSISPEDAHQRLHFFE